MRTLSGPFEQLWQLVRNRNVSLRLLLCLLAIGGLALSVNAPRRPFPYRLGQRCDYGVAARLDFQRPNPIATLRAQDDAAAQIQRIFRHDPTPLTRLPGQLQALLQQIAAVPTVDKVPPAVWQAFGLGAEQGATKRTTPRTAQTLKSAQEVLFQNVRNAVQIELIVKEFTDFLRPVQRNGLLNTLTIPGVSAAELTTLRIREPDQREHLAMLSEVQLAQVLGSQGLLGEMWKNFPQLEKIREPLEAWLTASAPETLTYDDQATQQTRAQARSAVQPISNNYAKGNPLIQPGALIDQELLGLLRVEFDAFEATLPNWQRIARIAVVVLIMSLLFIINGYFIVKHEPNLIRSASRLSIYLTVVVLTVALGRILSFDPWRAEVIPLISCVVIFAIAYSQFVASLTAASLSLILSVAAGHDLEHTVTLLCAAMMAVVPLREVSSRSTLIIVGFLSGVTYFLVAWGMAVLETQNMAILLQDTRLLIDSLRGAFWCLAAGFLVAGSLPFIESLFGVVTNISLLELGDVSHPLLAELVRRAPGTYNHSIAVASIAETAAESIGANGLLVKIGAYFHDIGKMLKPQYFVENMAVGEDNRHNQLAPAMSTLIIIGHVKDGVDLAEQQSLPRPIIDFIEQHHGTTLVEFFYREATKHAEQHPELGGEVQEADFRYPGPKPQSKETAILMLSDAVESASRTLSEPTPKRIERLVNDLSMKRLLDGQFDACGMTLTELNLVQESLVKSLTAIYHGRIKYPDQQRSA